MYKLAGTHFSPDEQVRPAPHAMYMDNDYCCPYTGSQFVARYEKQAEGIVVIVIRSSAHLGSFQPRRGECERIGMTVLPADIPAVRTCPATQRHPGDPVGCGSANVSQPDEEGLCDCLDCGMWFRADEV